MNTQTVADRLILIGSAKDCFDADMQPIRQQSFKYIVVKDPNKDYIQILVMVMYLPFEYHAEALLNHMDENNIPEILVNGGGKLSITPGESCYFHGKSYAFKHPWPEEIEQLQKDIWPNLKFLNNSESSAQGNMSVSGKLYTRAQVKYEADHP